jgi:hypothetical protein
VHAGPRCDEIFSAVEGLEDLDDIGALAALLGTAR